MWGGLFVSWIALQCTPAPKKRRFTVVATTSMIGDTLQQVVKDKAQVITLMGPGVDPHAYKATQQDVQALTQADLVFYNGLHLEGKMADMLGKLAKKKAVYAAGQALQPSQHIADPNFPTGVDPHIWFDLRIWQQVVRYICSCVQSKDPQNKDYYQHNADEYLKKLEALDNYVRASIAKVPLRQRVLITAHDAFSYFGRAYDIEVRGLQGISTVSECGLRDVTELVNFIVSRNIKAIFLETSVPERPLRAVVEGCKKRGHAVSIGGYLYSDALGESGTDSASYEGMVRANTNTIVEALR